MGNPGSIEDVQPFAELAQNATTIVYKAYQKSLERFVLLKRLRTEYSTDPELARRFEEEARIVARVQHPNVVAIYSYGADARGTYIVAEFVEGYDLAALTARGRLHPHIAAYILLESARGLKAAHDRDVLHRDLKPSNILVSHQGEVKLADFGLASISGSTSDVPSEIRGTLAYLAPEQILGKPAEKRSDLFSLGATFYEMLTGRRAFPGSTSSEIFDSILSGAQLGYLPATPGVDRKLEGIVERLLAREPEDRFSNADELIPEIEEWLDGKDVGREDLAAFLEDPDSFVPHPAAQTEQIEAPAPRKSVARRAVLAGGILLFSVALVYAGVSMLAERTNSTEAAGISLETDTASFVALVDSASGREVAAPTPDSTTAEVDVPPPTSEEERPVQEVPARTPPESDEGEARVVMTGRFVLRVDPAAEVFVDGQPVGRADTRKPLDIERPEGTYDLSLRNVRFPVHEQSIRIEPGKTTSLDVSLFDKMGWLELRISPWAFVYLDGESFEDRTIETFMLVPGVHRLRLVHPGYKVDYSTEIMVARGDTVRREFKVEDLKR